MSNKVLRDRRMSTTQQGGNATPPAAPPPPPKPFWAIKVTVGATLHVPTPQGVEGVTAANVESIAKHEDAAWAFEQALSQVRAMAPVLQQGLPAEKKEGQ